MRILVPGAHIFVASNPLLSHIVAGSLYNSGLENRGIVTRLVMTMRGGDRPKNAHKEFSYVTVMPRSMAEPWLLFRKPLEGRVQDNLRKWGTGGLRRVSKDKPFGDVIESHPTRSNERRLAPHPSLKPQAFLRRLVRASLPLGQGVVLDPFAGSGSTYGRSQSHRLPKYRHRVVGEVRRSGLEGTAGSTGTQVSHIYPVAAKFPNTVPIQSSGTCPQLTTWILPKVLHSNVAEIDLSKLHRPTINCWLRSAIDLIDKNAHPLLPCAMRINSTTGFSSTLDFDSLFSSFD